jgi:hypothetical protein
LTDQNTPAFLAYNGRISIEIRGTTSQWTDKKPYGLTTLKNDNVSNNNVSILGMPSENDWVLNAMTFDTALMRDYLTYDLARSIGEYAARGQFCEVVVNGDYKGLYVFMEKIKINSGRINIEKLKITDNSLPALTGGYFTKCDKVTGGDPVAWSFPASPSSTPVTVDFIHESPKPAEVTAQQDAFIHNQFDMLESLAQSQNASVADGFPSVIDVPTFVRFMTLNELAGNVDAYQYSTFFHKDRGGKLRAGPVWDFNLSFGLDVFGNRSLTNVWQFDNGSNDGAIFWKNLFLNPTFKCYLSKKWLELTVPGGPLSYPVIQNRIDAIVLLTEEARTREHARWGNLANYASHIDNLKIWLQDRINWLNANIGSVAGCTFPLAPPVVISKIHYNPVNAMGFTSDDLEFIELTNNSSVSTDITGFNFSELGVSYVFPAGSVIPPNGKIHLCSKATAFSQFYGVTPFGTFSRNLSNKSQNLVLADPFGDIVDVVNYSDSSPWPPQADGSGPYLKLTGLNLDNSLASSWTTSNEPLSVTLPLKLLAFTGRAGNGINQLHWQTASETNSSYFDIERSGAGEPFRKLGTVAASGNTSGVVNYQFDDSHSLPGTNFYRLKLADIDGRYEYSSTIAITTVKSDSVTIFPNPVHNRFYVNGISKKTFYTIKNMLGQLLLKGQVMPGNSINVETLGNGVYYILINEKTTKFIKR